jgi:glycosyltransferase involved in cell wall biosynthesis
MTATHQGARPVVALLPGYPTIEDFLAPLSLSLDDFTQRMEGGWLFGYVAALATAGVEAMVVCFSTSVRAVQRRVHTPTGATILVVPSPRRALALRAVGRRAGPAAGLARHALHLTATPVAATARALAGERCAALLCQEYEYPRFEASLLIGRRLGVPVFGVFEGADRGLSPVERPIRRWTVPAAAGLVVAPREERERVQARYGLGADRVAPIFNPLDVGPWAAADRDAARSELGLSPSGRVVAWHGRTEIRKKGLDVLLDAWERLTERDAADVLLLLGAGSDEDRLAEEIARRGLPGISWRREYVLAKSEIARHLAAADVYAFPSRFEGGSPVALAEAMAVGLPVVATEAWGVREIIEGGRRPAGIVVSRADPEAMADAIAALLEDPARARELGDGARERARDAFSLQAVGRALREFMLSAVPTAPE